MGAFERGIMKVTVIIQEPSQPSSQLCCFLMKKKERGGLFLFGSSYYQHCDYDKQYDSDGCGDDYVGGYCLKLVLGSEIG